MRWWGLRIFSKVGGDDLVPVGVAFMAEVDDRPIVGVDEQGPRCDVVLVGWSILAAACAWKRDACRAAHTIAPLTDVGLFDLESGDVYVEVLLYRCVFDVAGVQRAQSTFGGDHASPESTETAMEHDVVSEQ